MRISVACWSAINQQLLFLEIPLQRSYYSASRDGSTSLLSPQTLFSQNSQWGLTLQGCTGIRPKRLNHRCKFRNQAITTGGPTAVEKKILINMMKLLVDKLHFSRHCDRRAHRNCATRVLPNSYVISASMIFERDCGGINDWPSFLIKELHVFTKS